MTGRSLSKLLKTCNLNLKNNSKSWDIKKRFGGEYEMTHWPLWIYTERMCYSVLKIQSDFGYYLRTKRALIQSSYPPVRIPKDSWCFSIRMQAFMSRSTNKMNLFNFCWARVWVFLSETTEGMGEAKANLRLLIWSKMLR